jgi:hypothetical protein
MEKDSSQLYDRQWICDSAVCIDISQHTNELKIKLLRVNHQGNEMTDKITSFERKFLLWDMQL